MLELMLAEGADDEVVANRIATFAAKFVITGGIRQSDAHHLIGRRQSLTDQANTVVLEGHHTRLFGSQPDHGRGGTLANQFANLVIHAHVLEDAYASSVAGMVARIAADTAPEDRPAVFIDLQIVVLNG